MRVASKGAVLFVSWLVACVLLAGLAVVAEVRWGNGFLVFFLVFLPMFGLFVLALVLWARCPHCGCSVGWKQSWGGRYFFRLLLTRTCPRCSRDI